jgi:WD40 repeat protein
VSVALDHPPPPVAHNYDLPTPLSDLVMRLLAKKPEERPQSAEEVAAALKEIEEQIARSKARPERKPPKGQGADIGSAEKAKVQPQPAGRRWQGRRRPAVLAGLAFAAFALLAGVTIVIVNREGKRTEIEVPDGSRVVVDPQGKFTVTVPAEPKRAASKTLEIVREPLKLKPGEPVSGRALVRRPKPLPGLRSWTVETVPNRERMSRAFRPDGRQLVTGGIDGTVRIWEPGKDRPLRVLLGHEGWDNLVAAWSPDGKYLASCCSAEATLRFWDALTGRLLRTLPTPAGGTAVVWSPDGRVVASGGYANTAVRLWDVASGKEGTVFPSPEKDSFPKSLAWSSDGKLLAGGWVAGKVCVWDIASGQTLHTWACDDVGPVVFQISFSADGRRLAVAVGGNRAYIWDIASGKPVATLEHNASVSALGWSPDDQHLISCCYDQQARFWDPGSGKLLRTVPANSGTMGVLSPGGKVLASGDGSPNLYFFDFESQSSRTVLGIDSSRNAAWSPRGDRLALPHGSGGTTIWEAGSGRLLRRLADAQQGNGAVAWSPTGQVLAVAAVGSRHRRQASHPRGPNRVVEQCHRLVARRPLPGHGRPG